MAIYYAPNGKSAEALAFSAHCLIVSIIFPLVTRYSRRVNFEKDIVDILQSTSCSMHSQYSI